MVRRLLDGDAQAFLALARLVNSFLVRWRAYDFSDEWEDLIQEVVAATSHAVGSGRLREAAALPGYVKAVTRNKLADRLKARLRVDRHALVPWEEWIAGDAGESEALPAELRSDLRSALEALPEKKRAAVCGVYLEGKTYEQVSREAGIPLGTLKRYLRDGLAELRESLAAYLGHG